MRKFRPLLIALVLGGVLVYALSTHGVQVVVRNRGSSMLRDVHVNVTGRSHELGDVGPEQSRSVRVEPTGKSQIELTFADGDGVSKPLVINCYFGPSHYTGRITIDVAGNQVLHVDNQITTSWW